MIPAFILAIETEEEKKTAEKIFEEMFPQMKRTAYDILQNKHDAEDAAMNAVKSICDNIDSFMDYNSPASISLIISYTKNAAIDMYRKNRRNGQKLQGMHENIRGTDCTDIPENIAVSTENSQLLSDAINSLDEMYRIPLILQYTHNMKQDEIGAILNIDTGTVTGRIFRAKKQLAKILSERETRQ